MEEGGLGAHMVRIHPAQKSTAFLQHERAGNAPGAAKGEDDRRGAGQVWGTTCPGAARRALGQRHRGYRAATRNWRGWCMKETKTTSKRGTRHQQAEIPQLDL